MLLAQCLSRRQLEEYMFANGTRNALFDYACVCVCVCVCVCGCSQLVVLVPVVLAVFLILAFLVTVLASQRHPRLHSSFCQM